jgi:hypothetical protein
MQRLLQRALKTQQLTLDAMALNDIYYFRFPLALPPKRFSSIIFWQLGLFPCSYVICEQTEVAPQPRRMLSRRPAGVLVALTRVAVPSAGQTDASP